MGEPIGQYFKFMSDIIDSGTWAKLSAGARTLYPVLLKFSDQNFKKVWPSTSTLMKLTGFKNKRSIIDAKRDLVNAGLIHIIPGKGHKNSVYSFTFCYEREVYGNAPQGSTKMHLGGISGAPHEVHMPASQGVSSAAPNNINITIQNTQNQKEEKSSRSNTVDLKDRYSQDIVRAAYQKAEKLGLGEDVSIVEAFCREASLDLLENKHDFVKDSWHSFMVWAKSNLTEKSKSQLLGLDVAFIGNDIILTDLKSEFLETIIRKYYDDNYSKIGLKIVKNMESSRSRLF